MRIISGRRVGWPFHLIKATQRTAFVNLFDGLQPLTPPRFARQRRLGGPTSGSAGKPLIFSPDFVAIVSFVGFVTTAVGRGQNVVVSSYRRVVQARSAIVDPIAA